MESAKQEIQSYWEVASVAHFCFLFRKQLKLPSFDFETLEDALLEPIKPDGDEIGKCLIDKIMYSLVGGYFNNFALLDSTNFDVYLRQIIEIEWVTNDKLKNPLSQISLDENGEERVEWLDFHSLHIRTKVQILNKLCDYRLAADDSSTFVKDAAGKLRHKPIGIDSLGYVYWYFHGRRLYKEKPRVAKILVEKLREPMKPVNGLSSSPIRESSNEDTNEVKSHSPVKENPSEVTPELPKSPTKDEDEELVEDEDSYSKKMASGQKNQTTLWNWLKKIKPEPKSNTDVPYCVLKESWSIICHNVQDWRKLIERLKKSLSLPDRELAERFKLTYLPKAISAEEIIIKRQQKEERERLIALMPKRHSDRIKTKLASREQLLQSNVIDNKLRTRGNRDALRQMYRDACWDSDEEEKKKLEAERKERREKERLEKAERAKNIPVVNHRYGTRRKQLAPEDQQLASEDQQLAPEDQQLAAEDQQLDETSQTSSGVGSSLYEERLNPMNSPDSIDLSNESDYEPPSVLPISNNDDLPETKRFKMDTC